MLKKPRYQGGGSSHINSSKVTSALESAKEKGRTVSYVKGFPFDKDEENAEELAAAVQAAKDAEVAVIFAGLPDMMEAEGYDRKDMKLNPHSLHRRGNSGNLDYPPDEAGG